MNKVFAVLLILFSALPLVAQPVSHPLLPATWNIRSGELMGFVEELAGPVYEGRLTGSPGYRKAASYVSERLAEWGLKPGYHGSWFQEFSNPYNVPLPGCSLELIRRNGRISYHYYDEFMPGSSTGSGSVTAEVIFAGYGITAPELYYDDYESLDVKGKIILILPEAPVSPSIGPEAFRPWLEYSTHQYKMKNALAHGVAGIVYNYGPLANTNNDCHPELLLTLVGSKVVNDLFDGTGRNYEETVKQIGTQLKPHSFDLEKRLKISNISEYHPEGIGMNVIGVLPGTDSQLKEEVILIGAHLDHCGQCWEICPGANDNASGVAVLMGIAKALSTSGIPLRRSVVFIATGSEEQGLIGAGNYVKEPAFPLNQTIGYINLDCVGVGPNLHAGGAATNPELFTPVETANRIYVHRNLTVSPMGRAGRPRSDAAIFDLAGIPSISFSSYGGRGAYHTPGDTPATIWEETLEDLTTILTLAVADLAGLPSQ